MKSNVCKIDNGVKDLEAILKESEKVAVYNELTHKQSLQLRLICEEIDSMLPKIVNDFDGDFWIDFEDGVCKVNVSFKLAEFSVDKKKELIDLSKNKKNSAAVGVTGKIRSALENFFLGEEVRYAYAVSSSTFQMTMGYMDYSCLWTLEDYKNAIKSKEEGESWDELEKSVIASVADDVLVGVKGKDVNIVIIKKFA